MIKLEYVPNGLQAINEWYGGPPAHIKDHEIVPDKEWYRENTKYFKLPFPLRLGWDLSQVSINARAHKKIIPALRDALIEIRNYGGYDFLRKYNLEIWNGIRMLRFAKDSKRLSLHAYLAAIDYCPHLGPYKERSRMPYFIVMAFLSRGFVTFPRFDGMHFQAARGY